MPVRLFTDRSDVNRAYFVLKQRHEPYLSGVSSVTVIKMLRIVQEVVKGLEMGKTDSLKYVWKMFKSFNTLQMKQFKKLTPSLPWILTKI